MDGVGVDDVRELFPVETCVGCRAGVRRVMTEGHRRITIDADPVDDAPVVIRRVAGAVRAFILGGSAHRDADEVTFREHRHRPAPEGPPCRGCTFPMDPVLGRTELYHPTCAPNPEAMRAALDTARTAPAQEALDL